MGNNYTVVADPRGRDLPSGPVICTGDLLDLAPPPGTDPTGSLLVELVPDVRTAYEENDVGAILACIRSICGDERLCDVAEARYRTLFTRSDQLYYVAGNQDVPVALSQAAADFEHVTHVSELDAVAGIDGLIPNVAGTPPGTFPCECSCEQFSSRVESADADVLVAHTLPEDFEPIAHGFSTAISSTNDEMHASVDQCVLRLPSYRETGITARLALLSRNGVESALEVSVPFSSPTNQPAGQQNDDQNDHEKPDSLGN